MPRPPAAPLPCGACPKVPPKAEPRPESAVELTPEHRETVRYYEECRAVGSFPDDPIVRWAARVLRSADDHVEKALAARSQMNVLTLMRGA